MIGEEFQSKYRVDVFHGATVRLTIMNIEIGDTGTYVFQRDLDFERYSVIFHGKYEITYGGFTACFGDTAYRRDAHSGA